jgi:DNA-binding transcriptional LysR family regulator
LVARKVGVFEFGFYATPDYLERFGVPRVFDDLNDHTVIGYDRREISVPGGLDIGRPITRDIFALRTDNDVAQLAALKAGFGIGVCQHRVGRRAGLVHVLPGTFSFELETWIAMHENLKGVRRMRLMFDHLAETLTKACAESRG